MRSFIAELFPLLYGVCCIALLIQAFRVMGQGFRAVPRPGDQFSANGDAPASDSTANATADRTGRLTIHPELLDADGQLTREDLLTVRFGGDNEKPVLPGDPS